MILFYYFILGTFAFIFQTSLFSYLSFGNIRVDVVLIVVVYTGLFKGRTYGIIVGAIFGFIQDCLSVGALGLNTLLKGFIGYVLGNINDTIVSENTVTYSFFIFSSSFFNDILSLIMLNYIFFPRSIGTLNYLPNVMYEAGLNTIAGHILFSLIGMAEKRYKIRM